LARAWETLERVTTPDGVLELRRRGPEDFLILQDGRVLMNSSARRSEEALGRLAIEALADNAVPRVLVAGLGMGCTLRAVLDAVGSVGRVDVAELNGTVIDWCHGPLGELTSHAIADPRVTTLLANVNDVIADAQPGRYDAIVLDLYLGPPPGAPAKDPNFGWQALARIHAALGEGGVLAVWSEDPDPAFLRALEKAKLPAEVQRPGRGGRRHAVYLARRARR
jgi:spermidine synthase